jgi:hypothetical protein
VIHNLGWLTCHGESSSFPTERSLRAFMKSRACIRLWSRKAFDKTFILCYYYVLARSTCSLLLVDVELVWIASLATYGYTKYSTERSSHGISAKASDTTTWSKKDWTLACSVQHTNKKNVVAFTGRFLLCSSLLSFLIQSAYNTESP